MVRPNNTTIEKALINHISQEESTLSRQAQDIQQIKHTLYGNPDTRELGMATKVNEMYEMLVAAKGGKNLLMLIVLLGAAMSALVLLKKYF